MNPEERRRLAEAMDWIIPPDSSPGAGTDAGVERLLELVASLPSAAQAGFTAQLMRLQPADLDDSSNAFAQQLIDLVRDVYYGYSDSGAWADLGFRVREP